MATTERYTASPAYAGMPADLAARDPRLIEAAARARPHSMQGVDIRLSVPLAWRRYYLAIIAGSERREVSRRVLDCQTRPLATLRNVIFVSSSAAILMLICLAALLLASGGIEI